MLTDYEEVDYTIEDVPELISEDTQATKAMDKEQVDHSTTTKTTPKTTTSKGDKMKEKSQQQDEEEDHDDFDDYDVGPTIQRLSILEDYQVEEDVQFDEQVVINESREEQTVLRTNSESTYYDYDYYRHHHHHHQSQQHHHHHQSELKNTPAVDATVPPAPSLFPPIIPLEFDPSNGGIPLLPDGQSASPPPADLELLPPPPPPSPPPFEF